MRTLMQTVEWSRRNSFPRPLPEPNVYSPRIRPDQVRALYYLKPFEGRAMTKPLQEALDRYLEPHGGAEALVARGIAEFGERGDEFH